MKGNKSKVSASTRRIVTFDDIADRYDEWEETPLGAISSRLERQIFLSLFDEACCSGPVLDVGCGTGGNALLLARRGFAVTGVDISDKMLKTARAKTAKEGLKVDFLQADASRIPFPDESFGTVTCLLALEFTGRPDKVIQEIYRVLCPHGCLILALLNQYSPWAVLSRIKGWRRPSVYSSAHFFSRHQVAELLLKTGFSGLSWRKAVYFPPLDMPVILNFYRVFEVAGRLFFPWMAAYMAVRGTQDYKF